MPGNRSPTSYWEEHTGLETRLLEATVISSGHGLLEAPRWHQGSLYTSDMIARRVMRWTDRNRAETLCEVPGRPSGLGWTDDDELLVVSMEDLKLLRLRDGVLEEFADLSRHTRHLANDLVGEPLGGAYVGGFGFDDAGDTAIEPTNLQRVAPDGTVTVAAAGVVCPNGMALSPDGGTLLVAETFASRISAFGRSADGSLGRRHVWASFSNGAFTTARSAREAPVVFPDGIALDADGALWVADSRGSGAMRISEGGGVLAYVSTAPRATYAVALGGPDRRTLFLCTARPYPGEAAPAEADSALQACRVPVPGVDLP